MQNWRDKKFLSIEPIGLAKPQWVERIVAWKVLNQCRFLVQENFDKREKKAQITFPLRHFFPLKVVK
jgi:hypothetical protein